MTAPDEAQLDGWLAEARRVVCKAAQFIREQSDRIHDLEVEEKFHNGLVSFVDRRAEELLVEGLSALLPQAGFLTEEATVPQRDAALRWVIDPLDGTTNFLYDLPHYAVSVALCLGREPLLGVVEHVPRSEQYYARKGGGAWMNERPIRASARPTLANALVATGFPYHNPARIGGWTGALTEFLGAARGVRRYGAAALDMAWLACGRFDVFFEYGLNPWDVAAGALLVQEAGGRTSDFAGTGNGVWDGEMLAANALVADEALSLVKRHF
ncbi:MAG: inositol monophosphatase family protein [Saprospiraceae bacterium]